MNYSIDGISIENFKSYAELQRISISDLSVFLGANSSGKSTAIQTLLAMKQTTECNSKEIELLLSGRYVALGEFDDVIYKKSRKDFVLGIDFKCVSDNETMKAKDTYAINWIFEKAEDKFQAILKQVKITYEDRIIIFERASQNKYQMIVDGEMTPLFISICNLKLMSRVFLKYDTGFNREFANFINEMKETVEGKKCRKIASNQLVSLRVVPEFYMGLIGDNLNIDERKNHENEELADRICCLIDEYSLFQNPFESDYFGMPLDFKKDCILSFL